MSVLLKNIFFSIFFNSSLFILLIIGIQNSSKKSKVYFFNRETVFLPISFIVGGSFISGSLTASFYHFRVDNKNNSRAINLSGQTILEIPLELKEEQQS